VNVLFLLSACHHHILAQLVAMPPDGNAYKQVAGMFLDRTNELKFDIVSIEVRTIATERTVNLISSRVVTTPFVVPLFKQLS